jgi:DNA polymerase-3 subunit epsilon
MIREIVIDTETTGLDAHEGHRVVEIGCVELIDRTPSGKIFHCYINPEREIPREAVEIHGLTTKFLRDKPKFNQIDHDFLAFISDAPLIAHNAEFDRRFINSELIRLWHPQIPPERMVDTLALARQRHLGARHTLDALCKRYGVSLVGRTKHGALLDAELLALVYPGLLGLHDVALDFGTCVQKPKTAEIAVAQRPHPLAARITAADLAMHAAFVDERLNEAIWRDYR